MLPIARDTIAVMRLMQRRLAANWAGNRRKRLRAGFVKRWNGTANAKWVENVKSGAYQSWIEQNYEGRQ